MHLNESLKQSKYRLLGLVGQGQFGQVFCAVHRQTGQLVALKNLERQRFPTHQFLRELRFLLSLQHKHIVSCYAIEHTRTGRYLVMDYCEGGTLRGLMEEENHLRIDQSLKIVSDILQGLEHAHSRGIVHCDIKPENILLRLKPKGWTAKISDFGIARLSQELSRQSGSNTGSPAYMAPERFYGQYSPTSDLYSVGIMLFELLAGYRPFSGAPGALMGAHLNQHVRFSDAIPEVIQPIIHKSLQKLSARRFNSASQMLEALRQAASDLNMSLDSTTFSLDEPLLESRVVPIACSFDAVQCDRLPIAAHYLTGARGARISTFPNDLPPVSSLEGQSSDNLDPEADQSSGFQGLPASLSQKKDVLIAYGAINQFGFQLRKKSTISKARPSSAHQSLEATASPTSPPVITTSAANIDATANPNAEENVDSNHSNGGLPEEQPVETAATVSTVSAVSKVAGEVLAAQPDPSISTSVASQPVSTIAASVLFSQPIQAISVRPQGCFVLSQHTLHLISNQELYQSEPMADLIHQFEQDCTSALCANGHWIATVADMRQVIPKSGFSTLSFYPLPLSVAGPVALAQQPARLTMAGEASSLLQAIALDSRHVAVISDVPSIAPNQAANLQKRRMSKAIPGGTHIEVFTRRGTRIGALSMPILLGQVISTTTPYRLLATDQYDLYSILQIDLKPFRVVRYAVQIVPQFLAAASWGYLVMNAQGHIVVLDQQGYQVNRIEGPPNPTAIAMIDPTDLLIATQDRQQGRLYTVDLRELELDILF